MGEKYVARAMKVHQLPNLPAPTSLQLVQPAQVHNHTDYGYNHHVRAQGFSSTNLATRTVAVMPVPVLSSKPGHTDRNHHACASGFLKDLVTWTTGSAQCCVAPPSPQRH